MLKNFELFGWVGKTIKLRVERAFKMPLIELGHFWRRCLNNTLGLKSYVFAKRTEARQHASSICRISVGGSSGSGRAAIVPDAGDDDKPLAELVKDPEVEANAAKMPDAEIGEADVRAAERPQGAGQNVVLNQESCVKDLQARLRELDQPIYGTKEQLSSGRDSPRRRRGTRCTWIASRRWRSARRRPRRTSRACILVWWRDRASRRRRSARPT